MFVCPAAEVGYEKSVKDLSDESERSKNKIYKTLRAYNYKFFIILNAHTLNDDNPYKQTDGILLIIFYLLMSLAFLYAVIVNHHVKINTLIFQRIPKTELTKV